MAENKMKAYSVEEFKDVLKKHNLKATSQRLAVHKAMLDLGHASADMVAKYIETDNKSTITVASIYNILSQLAILGVYQYRMSSNSKMYFDVNIHKHIHLYDTVNNTFKDIMDDELIEMIDSYMANKKFRGYKVDSIDIQICCHPTGSKSIKQS